MFPVDLFFPSVICCSSHQPDFASVTAILGGGPGHPRYIPQSLALHLPGTAPLIPLAESLGVRGDERGLDGLLGMLLIPKAVTSVRVGLTAQALFIQTGGPCICPQRRVLPGVAGWKGGEGIWSLPEWPAQPETRPSSQDEEGSMVDYRNSDCCF